jgi:hypothetical protein
MNVLKFKGSWRFMPPPDGKWNNQTIPSSALDDFYNLIAKTTTQGNRQKILEHFKGAFCTAIGIQHVWSSSESWSETDLRDYMERATNNAPLFLEAFYDACISLVEQNPDFFAPNAEIINNVCVQHNIGYEIRPPELILREIVQSSSENTVSAINSTATIANPKAIANILESHELKIFLCHSSSDKPKVRELYHRLHNDGFDPWFDEESILPGQLWQVEIPKAVRNSDVVIVCLSSRSVTKEGFVQKEIRIALDTADEKLDETIFIIPARLEDCDVPERLKRFQWVDLFSTNGYGKLLQALKIRAESLGIKNKGSNITNKTSFGISKELWKETVDEIVNLPNIHDTDSRRSILFYAFGRDSIIYRINFSGSSFDFVNGLLNVLVEEPYLEDRKLAIVEMLNCIKDNFVGANRAKHIAQLMEKWATCYGYKS